ncbi:hypothetical protein VPH35_028985 [Triticum aestivum]
MLHPEHTGSEVHREAPKQLSQSPSVQEEPRGQRSQQRHVQEVGLDGLRAVREGHVHTGGQQRAHGAVRGGAQGEGARLRLAPCVRQRGQAATGRFWGAARASSNG